MLSLDPKLLPIIVDYSSHLRALSPLRLTPVGASTEIRSGSTKVAPRTAESRCTLSIDNRSASIPSICNFRCPAGKGRSFAIGAAVAVARLTAGSAVNTLVLNIVFGPAVSSRAAASIEIALLASTGAAYATLRVATDVDVGNAGSIRVCGRRAA